MRGFTYKGLSTCLVGAHIAVMFYHSFHDSGIGISSRSDRPVGLLRTKAQGGCCKQACVQWCEVRRRVLKRTYSGQDSGQLTSIFSPLLGKALQFLSQLYTMCFCYFDRSIAETRYACKRYKALLQRETDQKLMWYVPSQSALQLKFRSARVTFKCMKHQQCGSLTRSRRFHEKD